MQAEPLLQWSDPVKEFVGFVSQFLALGAIGFRYAAVRHRLRPPREPAAADLDFEPEHVIYADAAQRAASIGVAGALVQLLIFMTALPNAAARAHVSADYLLTHDAMTIAQFVLAVAAVLGFALAAVRRQIGWPIAAVGVIVGPLTGIVTGKWSRLVNPAHRIVGGLWIGTLFVLVFAGLVLLLRDVRVRNRRGAMAADLVNGFSPLALTCGMLLVASGLVTAWNHLNPLSSLWTTPYGYALIAKLCVVAIVFALGAWNWRRQRPLLGTEDAAHALRRSATKELLAATVVLMITAVLVSLPSPKPPARPGSPPPAAPAP
ncbi:MAG TPA: CopD family protein [Gemmatimonadaceae bacterium]